MSGAVPHKYALSAIEYKTYEVCHFVFFATDWCTRPEKWLLFETPAIRQQVQTWLEDSFTKAAARVTKGDYEFLEVFIEITMCLTVMISTKVTNADQVLPQVGARVYLFICTTF